MKKLFLLIPVIALLAVSCNKTSQNTPAVVNQQTQADTSSTLVYTNTDYGFQLTFTPAWAGYKVVKTNQSYGSHPYVQYSIQLPAPSWQNGYGTPFSISVYPLSTLQYLAPIDAERAQKGKLGQNDKYLFTNAEGTWQDIPVEYENKDLQIPQVKASFKFTK